MKPQRAKKKLPLKSKTANFSSMNPQIEEIYNSKGLVGRIIEKGFSSSSSSNPLNSTSVSLPQPTILPFPVARHRSHGPHWNSLSATMEQEEDDDKDVTDYSFISSFACLVERKEKKDLDFSRWRDFITQSSSTVMQPNDSSFSKLNNSIELKPTDEKKKNMAAFPQWPNEEFENLGDEPWQMLVKDSLEEPDVSVKRDKSSRNVLEVALDAASNFSNVGMDAQMLMPNMQGFGSIMEDIDVENLSRLKQMSLEEIVNAQSEIIEKMNPIMVDMLKKRGKKRLGIKKVAAFSQEKDGQDMASVHHVKSSKNSGKDKAGNEPSPKATKINVKPAMHADWVSAGQVNSNSWNMWNERVEKVRELRFTLEGDILEADSVQVLGGCKFQGIQPDVGNVAERDFLRTEGNPAALGYSIMEMITLTRSMVPAQRAFALKLLDSILIKAMFNLLSNKDLLGSKKDTVSSYVDWQAIWAYSLGPEPQLVLSLRIALDDNHHSVVLACANVLQSILSFDMNEYFFNVAEKVPTFHKVLCTAPVFRSRTEIDSSFLQGGFWKYSTKSSNILPSNINKENEDQGEHTIQDDIVVVGQDIAAGLVRMGILPRICYLLEMEPVSALVECLISVLIELARHSPACANAIVQCPRLVQNIVDILTRQGMMELPCQIKAITVLKVLSQMDERLCSYFVKGGVFQKVMWHWYRNFNTIDHWVESGKENCKLTAALMVEQLRLWKVCISYGYCVEYFADFFPRMCLWLTRPTFSKLIEFNVLGEFSHISREAYLTLSALVKCLPFLHSMDQLAMEDLDIEDDVTKNWSWSHVISMINLAISWLSLNDIPYVFSINHCFEENDLYNASASSMIWVISAVLHMLCCVFDRMSPIRTDDGRNSTSLPWLPEFVPKVGLEILKNQFFSFANSSEINSKGNEGRSLVDGLCYLRHQGNFDMALSCLTCLHGLIQLVSSVDNCIQSARAACDIQILGKSSLDSEGKILSEGMIKWTGEGLTRVLDTVGNLISSEGLLVQSIEAFGRGGPAPGVGVGWGSPGGGFWSLNILLAQEDARVFLEILKTFPIVHDRDITSAESPIQAFGKSPNSNNLALQKVKSVLAAFLVLGPGDKVIAEEALNILFQPRVLKYLGLLLYHFLQLNNSLKPFKWKYEDKDYLLFSKILKSHFRERWLSIKIKSADDRNELNQSKSRKSAVLETIHEALENHEVSELNFKDTACRSFCIQWVNQRLPVPMHWFLSAICSIGELKNSNINSLNELDLAKGGLLFLLCLEVLYRSVFANQDSPFLNVSLVWKLHALSMSLHANVAILEDERSRDVFELMQQLYGKQLDELRHREKQGFQDSLLNISGFNDNLSEVLSFQSQISNGYTTFVENLIEQFGAVSYGDVVFGRQVSIYLHRTVDIPIRLAAWNALSNSHLLELLPSLEECFSEAEGYLEPAEDNEAILEAYTKSWCSGAINRAFTRGSLGFSLAQHHLHSFIFGPISLEKLSFHDRLTKSLLRSYSHHNSVMLPHLVKYELPVSQDPQLAIEIDRRIERLKATCEGNSSLIAVVEIIKSSL